MSLRTLQSVATASNTQEPDRERRTRGILSQQSLRRQNRAYAGSGGVSCNCRGAGFAPGYLDTLSGLAVLSCFANGRPAPIHLLEGLPDSWVLQRDAQGQVLRVRPGVIAGFIRGDTFYTREEAARLVAA